VPEHLIVNADDYGRTASVSAGIRKAHREGIVTSTTAMMNMPGMEAELQTALTECPQLGLGVHLVLTAESPLLPPDQIPSVIALSDGRAFPRLDALMKNADRLNIAEVKAEWRAQIEKFVHLTSRPPDHLDSHHHISYLTPSLFGAMLELAREYGCAIRLPLADEADTGRVVSDLPPLTFLRPMLLASTDVPRPDRFEIRFYDERATLAMLHEIIDTLPEGVTEIMCHPGLSDEQLAAVSGYNRQRAAELAALTDPGLREHLRAAGVELTSFSELNRNK
jgi:predicted glycoside hydrolase/deacetylase ChbG (UPF0249 family)